MTGLQAMRRITATEVHRRLVSGCNGHGRWQALAGGGHRRGAGVIPAHGSGVEKGPRTTACMGGRTCTGAKPFKGDPAMRLLGQEPLRRGQGHQYQHNAGGVRQCSPCAGAGPSEGGKIRAPCMIRVLRTAKTPLGGKMFARCIPQRRFAGLFGCIARISCQK